MRNHFLRVNILEHIVALAALDKDADTEFISIQAQFVIVSTRNWLQFLNTSSWQAHLRLGWLETFYATIVHLFTIPFVLKLYQG